MNCELCGSSIRGEVQVVNIDGGVFRVCNNCSKLGTAVRIPKPAVTRASSSFGGRSAGSAPTKSNPSAHSPSFSYDDEEMMLREDYSKTIKNAREVLGLTQEELGRKINEKPSVISHLEVGTMKPNDVLVRKLEHFLKIELFVPAEDEISSDTR